MAEKEETPSNIFDQLAGMLPRDHQYYCNGFGLTLRALDAMLVFSLDGRPVATIHMPLSVIKTLGEQVGELIVQQEKTLGRKIPLLGEMQPGQSETENTGGS